MSRLYADHWGPTQDGLHILVVIDGHTRCPEVAVIKGTSADDNIQAFAEIFSRPRTGGDFELYLDDFQRYQDGIRTGTKATGGIETDARTGGNFEFGHDDFQRSQDGIGTDRTGGDFKLSQDDLQLYQDGIKTETRATGRIETTPGPEAT